MTLTSLFTQIANAIRAKDGTTGNIVASTFPGRILAIQTGVAGAKTAPAHVHDGVHGGETGQDITAIFYPISTAGQQYSVYVPPTILFLDQGYIRVEPPEGCSFGSLNYSLKEGVTVTITSTGFQVDVTKDCLKVSPGVNQANEGGAVAIVTLAEDEGT